MAAGEVNCGPHLNSYEIACEIAMTGKHKQIDNPGGTRDSGITHLTPPRGRDPKNIVLHVLFFCVYRCMWFAWQYRRGANLHIEYNTYIIGESVQEYYNSSIDWMPPRAHTQHPIQGRRVPQHTKKKKNEQQHRSKKCFQEQGELVYSTWTYRGCGAGRNIFTTHRVTMTLIWLGTVSNVLQFL